MLIHEHYKNRFRSGMFSHYYSIHNMLYQKYKAYTFTITAKEYNQIKKQIDFKSCNIDITLYSLKGCYTLQIALNATIEQIRAIFLLSDITGKID